MGRNLRPSWAWTDLPDLAMSGRLDYHGSCTCPSRWPTYVTVCLRTPAANLGRLFRPDNPNPLMLNWKHLPMVITAGRSRSWSRAPTSSPPSGSGRAHRRRRRCSGRGPGSTSPWRNRPASLRRGALQRLVRRDLQAWEYVPLGPHLGKSFASNISPYRCRRRSRRRRHGCPRRHP